MRNESPTLHLGFNPFFRNYSKFTTFFVSPKVEHSFSLMSDKLMSLKTRITNINLREIKQGLY